MPSYEFKPTPLGIGPLRFLCKLQKYWDWGPHFNNCPFPAEQGRYTWRHNAVLKLLVDHIQLYLPAYDELFVDLLGFKKPSWPITNILPDITVLHRGSSFILELTCCYEKNLESSKSYKIEKYNNPSQSCKPSLTFVVQTAEVSSLGFNSTNSPAKFCKNIIISSY